MPNLTPEANSVLKLGDVKVGDRLVADGGFTCIAEGAALTVAASSHGLYVPCAKGSHYLDGQEGDDGELIGLARAGEAA